MHRNIGVVILAAVTALAVVPVVGQENKQANPQPSGKTRVQPKQVAAPSFERFLERQDRNKDGQVSKDEFKGQAKWFDGMDGDGDGAVTKAEYTAAMERLKKTAQQRGGGRKLPEGVKAIRDVEYAKVDGQSLKLDLYLPEKSDAKPPLLVWIHGGGWTKGSKSGINPTIIRLTAEGYAAATIDYRLTGLQSHPKQIHDCKGAIRWLRANAEKYGYDATRIGVGGGSAGGHLVLLLGTSGGVKDLEGTVGGNKEQSSKVQAVLDLYGPSDMTLFGRQNKRFGEGKAADMLKSVSPVTYITKDDPPLLIFQGDKDPLVPEQQSEHMHKLYQKAGLDSSLHIIKGAAHGGPQFSDATRSALVKAFFDKHIKQVKAARTAERD